MESQFSPEPFIKDAILLPVKVFDPSAKDKVAEGTWSCFYIFYSIPLTLTGAFWLISCCSFSILKNKTFVIQIVFIYLSRFTKFTMKINSQELDIELQ